MRTLRSAGLLLAVVLALPQPARAQFIPYYGKNKVKYDDFAWRVYKSPHFEVYYYPEFEQHLARIASYAESAYQKVSADLKHELNFAVPLILYKTHSEFEQTNLFPDFISEGILAFAEPSRDRMVLPIDEPPDLLQGLITHELTHIFEFDLIPRNLIQRSVPLWVDEGLADYERGLWDPLDLMTIRDAAVTEQIPKLSRFEEYGGFNPRVVYNLGHAAFEFIEARYGKEGIRQFLYTLRKNIVGGSADDIYQQAFRIKPEEFDEAFEKWLKERFKPFRDKQRPSDYGRDLSPDAERTRYTQVIAFAPSPSGEVVAAVTANRSDGELDIVLLSARDRGVIRNLTSGYSNAFEDITVNFNARNIGRSIAFDPGGDAVAFFARTGKRRSLLLVSVLTGEVVRKVPLDLDEANAPHLLPDRRRVVFTALKDGVSDIFLMDLETGEYRNLTQDSFADADPQASPKGDLVVYSRRVSGYSKLYAFPLASPSQKTQLTFGTHDDVSPAFSPDGGLVYYASNEDSEIYNLRSLDLQTGVVRQYTDALGGNMAPAVLKGKSGDRIGFISYFKGEYRLHALETTEPVKEVEQEVRVADDGPVDFQPEVEHRVVAENKRKKRVFEKLFLEGRPPINVGVTSGGDFFGGSQVALSDVLGDQNFVLTAISLREFRSYEGTYVNLAKRLQYGLTAFDTTRFFYASPYGLQRGIFDRQGAFATQRLSGANLIARYPFDKFRRLEFSAGIFKLKERFENPEAEALAREQAALLGVRFFLNDGTLAPLAVNLVQETTRFREFGPLAGSTVLLGFELSPSLGETSLSRRTVELDARKYLRLGGTTAVLATRVRGFKSMGDDPAIFYFGGNMELRGFPYLSFSGHEGFFANAELRVPIIDVMKTPLGILGPVRGTLYAGVGGARFKGERFRFSSSGDGISYVNDPVFGEPVSGFHLVDGRASYGVGLQFFFLGYPLHFDWSKLTDLKVTSRNTRFDFWIGYDF
ncbi:MAG: PD40 domain-containing protein [Acidobacteria bacterium]|nr:PD40 domain-containing protein [Acidobacteriota bacterium]